jgi:hypothetical protein
MSKKCALLKGRRLNTGVSSKDYIVTVGNRSCEVVELTQNALHVMPSKNQVQRTSCDTQLRVSKMYY